MMMKMQAKTAVIAALLLVAGNTAAQEDSIPQRITEKYDSAYSFIYDFDESVKPILHYGVYKKGKVGVANADAVELLPISYEGVYTLNTTLPELRYFLVVKDSLCALFDHDYKQVTPFVYQFLRDIDRQYDEKATDKRQTLYYAMKDYKVGIIDSSGVVVLPFEYDKIGPYSQNCFVFMKDGKIGAVNDKNEMLLPFKYDMILPPNRYIDSLYAVQSGGKWALAHRGGNLVTDYIFSNVEDDIMKMTLYMGDNYYYLWSDFTEGLAAVRKDGKYGFIDKKGNLVLPMQYEGASPFSEGLAAVQGDNGWRFINKKGETVIAGPFYYCPSSFQNGYATITTDDGEYTIDKKGKRVAGK